MALADPLGAIAAPFAGCLERRRCLGGHVALVVLGEHLAGDKDAIRSVGALGDHALAFAEQVRKVAPVDNGVARGPVHDDEADGAVR